ncbi:extracellular solute-binding protein [Myxococcus sp. K15C18031901]|uniref:extracellular solute-binding protein n=1 Tax=Myxococcus dinghuensis TaxID=2906761 RepID=UPI0020A79AF5|nr:extracellular solute-binding protein [Myxococcus dinghuensis]MCP3102309.1 extracellular solute-binding protein [Myxococcus dinghuensis]
MSWRALPCAVLLALSACSDSPDPEPEPRRPLKAVLFPYIPDSGKDQFAGLKQRLEADFEAKHADIDLEVVFDFNLDVYDLDEGGALNTLLGAGDGAAQVVEVDTLVLGSLVSKGWVQPVRVDANAVHPAAAEAVQVSGESYGVPTYLCTNVVYSRSTNIRSATDSTSLVRILDEAAPGKRPLATNLDGSWTLPSAYLDAWADTHPGSALASAVSLPLDTSVVEAFSAVVESCALEPGVNPCMDGTYADNTLPEEAFATEAANGFMGYTERLFYILAANPSMALPEVISVPLGAGSSPTVFVDALVLNTHCTGTCAQDARAFTDFMKDPEVRTLIAFSQDAPRGSTPRYLLQANRAFYQQEPARSDPMYPKYEALLRNARPYPNQGFPENRKAMQAALLENLQ